MLNLGSQEMAKAKSPKLGLSFLTSFQICRSKDPSSMIKTSPSPDVSYMYSPTNSKTFDISFPSFRGPPPPSPSSITPLAPEYQSKSCKMQEKSSELENEFTSHAYCQPRNEVGMCSSPVSTDSDETDWRVAPSRTEKKQGKIAMKKSKAGIRTSISSGYNDETESLFSSPPSFNSSHDFNHRSKTNYKDQELGKKPVTQKSARARRFKQFDSKEWLEGGEYLKNRRTSGRQAPCMVDRKVNESFVVVKRSVDPYKDFKKSMSEMIMEKQIFEPKELEWLLMSFLSLNSTMHHKVIIEAFTEVLNEVFCG